MTGCLTFRSGRTKKRQAPPPAAPSLLSEFRFGFSAQDPWGPENGSANGTTRLLFAKPFTPADLFTSYFVPRPHLGGSVNFDGKTSYAYAGLTWSLDITSQFFVEGSVGGAVHNGDTHPFATPVDRAALGCSPLFREAGSIGVRLWRQLEHDGDARAHVGRRRLRAQSRLDEYRRAGWIHLLNATFGAISRGCAWSH